MLVAVEGVVMRPGFTDLAGACEWIGASLSTAES